ncbi:response regulator, partial [Streptomyces sp. TRM76130]|nr:response regulator [Streptomyces sp. TRM76130]
ARTASENGGPSTEPAPPRKDTARDSGTGADTGPGAAADTSAGTSPGTGGQDPTRDSGRNLARDPARDSRPAPTAAAEPAAHTNLTLLLIEDDPAGSPIVPDLLDQAGKPIRVRTARNLTEAARLLTDDVHCILLDLALPAPGGTDEDELAVLKHVLELAPRHAVLALTSSSDAERGAEAVAVGAQDYLFRDELDGRLLSRAIRYAVERKRSDSAERRLAEGRLRAQENRRLERGLLPTPLLDGSPLRFAARYRPGR